MEIDLTRTPEDFEKLTFGETFWYVRPSQVVAVMAPHQRGTSDYFMRVYLLSGHVELMDDTPQNRSAIGLEGATP